MMDVFVAQNDNLGSSSFFFVARFAKLDKLGKSHQADDGDERTETNGTNYVRCDAPGIMHDS